MFIRSLDEKELENEEFENLSGEKINVEKIFPQSEIGQSMRWSKFKDKDSREIYTIQNGQFRTPKHIREMMVELLDPTPDGFIVDPACGTAGFLVSAAEYIRKNYEDTMTSEQWEHFESSAFAGFDTDYTMLRISAMNLMLHSIANPPFKGTVDKESISDDLKAVTDTKKTELLFLALFLRLLQKGGRCACIVPDGVLFGSSKAHKAIRKELIENHKVEVQKCLDETQLLFDSLMRKYFG